jgi:hypothetical protein
MLFVGVNSNEGPDLNLKEKHKLVQAALDAASGVRQGVGALANRCSSTWRIRRGKRFWARSGAKAPLCCTLAVTHGKPVSDCLETRFSPRGCCPRSRRGMRMQAGPGVHSSESLW